MASIIDEAVDVLGRDVEAQAGLSLSLRDGLVRALFLYFDGRGDLSSMQPRRLRATTLLSRSRSHDGRRRQRSGWSTAFSTADRPIARGERSITLAAIPSNRL